MEAEEDDELEIERSARTALLPWFDSEADLEAWAIGELLRAADEHRLLRELPKGWSRVQAKRKLRPSLHFVETVDGPTPALLLFDLVPEGVTLRAGWTHPLKVGMTRHARERMHERMDKLEPDPQRQRRWLDATVDRAVRAESLTLKAPRWAASAPLRPGFGWAIRRLRGDEIALLVAAPSSKGGSWNIVTILTKSTAISPLGRAVRWWQRTSRALANRRHYGRPAPERERATRPPRIGDVTTPPRRNRR